MTVVVESVPVFKSTEEMFKYIVSFLHKQGGPAYDKQAENCKYRYEGKACAVGCLIPDSSYTKFCEGAPPEQALQSCGLHSEFYARNAGILSSLQVAHDDAADQGGYIEDSLIHVAEHHKIDAVGFVKSFDWSNWGK